jgi:hypothetical protein
MDELENKFILTAGLNHLSEANFMTKAAAKVLGLEQNSTLVPVGLDPTVAEGRALLDEVNGDIDERIVLEEQLKSKNEQIAVGKTKLKDMIITNWMPVLQISLNGNVANAKLLDFGVKGLDLQPSAVSVTNSHPKLDKIELGYLVHTLYFSNSTTNKTTIPDDGLSLEVYEYFGDDEPASIQEMSHIGKAIRGKYTNHFTEDQKGKNVWYAFVYSAKKANVIPELAGKIKKMVV